MIKTFKTALGTFAAACLVSSSLAGCAQTARAPGQYGGTGANYGTNNAGTTMPGRNNMAGTGYGSNVGYNTGYGYNGYTGNGYMGMNRAGYNGTNVGLGNQLGIGNNTGYGTTGYGTTGNRTGYGTTGYGTTGNRTGYGTTGYGTTPYGTNAGFGYTGYGTTGHGTNTNMGYTGYGTNTGTNTRTNMGTNFGTTGMNGTGLNTNTGTKNAGTTADALKAAALRKDVLATKGVNACEVLVVGDTALVGIKTNGTVSPSRCKADVNRKVKAADPSIKNCSVSNSTDILTRMRRLTTNLSGTTSNNLVGTSGRR